MTDNNDGVMKPQEARPLPEQLAAQRAKDLRRATDRMAQKQPMAFGKLRHSSLLKELAAGRWSVDVGKFDKEALDLALALLSKCARGVEKIELFDSAAGQNRSRRYGYPSGGDIQAKLARALPNALAKCTVVLEHVELRGLQLTPRAYAVLAKNLKKATGLKRLLLKNCNVGDKALAEIVDAVCDSNVMHVQLSGLGLTSESADAICRLVRKHMLMRDMLCWAHSLRGELEINPRGLGVTYLDVSRNNLGDSGIIRIIDQLASDPWICGVDLRMNGFTDMAMRALLEMLKTNTTIATVHALPNQAPSVAPAARRSAGDENDAADGASGRGRRGRSRGRDRRRASTIERASALPDDASQKPSIRSAFVRVFKKWQAVREPYVAQLPAEFLREPTDVRDEAVKEIEDKKNEMVRHLSRLSFKKGSQSYMNLLAAQQGKQESGEGGNVTDTDDDSDIQHDRIEDEKRQPIRKHHKKNKKKQQKKTTTSASRTPLKAKRSIRNTPPSAMSAKKKKQHSKKQATNVKKAGKGSKKSAKPATSVDQQYLNSSVASLHSLVQKLSDSMQNHLERQIALENENQLLRTELEHIKSGGAAAAGGGVGEMTQEQLQNTVEYMETCFQRLSSMVEYIEQNKNLVPQ